MPETIREIFTSGSFKIMWIKRLMSIQHSADNVWCANNQGSLELRSSCVHPSRVEKPRSFLCLSEIIICEEKTAKWADLLIRKRRCEKDASVIPPVLVNIHEVGRSLKRAFTPWDNEGRRCPFLSKARRQQSASAVKFWRTIYTQNRLKWM